MRLLSLLSAASLAAAFPLGLFGRDSNGTCPASSCGITGWEMHLPGHDAGQYWISQQSIYRTNEACGKHCVGDESCITFSVGEGSCRHYRRTINETMLRLPSGRNGTFAFYDRTCQGCPPVNMTSTAAPYGNVTAISYRPVVTPYKPGMHASETQNHGISTPEPFRPKPYSTAMYQSHASSTSLSRVHPVVPGSRSEYPKVTLVPIVKPHDPVVAPHRPMNADHGSQSPSYVDVPGKHPSLSNVHVYPTTSIFYVKPTNTNSPQQDIISSAAESGYSNIVAPSPSPETITSTHPTMPTSTSDESYPTLTPIFANSTSPSSTLSTPSFTFSNSSMTAVRTPTYLASAVPVSLV